MKVRNGFGVEVDFDSAVALMDDEVRERVHADMAPCDEQEFFSEYCKLHLEKFGEVFEPAKANPQW